ncbi:MAG: thylakoid-associated protein [Snowella sp.]|nr:thylakoid-associated protein [Snowella sp.]
MDKNTVFQTLQQGVRVTVGATASLLETLQDPQKRNTTLSELQSQLSQQTQLWAEKGLVTEEEARRLVDAWLAKQKSSANSTSSNPSSSTSPSSSVTFNNAQSEIQALTEQLIALKNELEQARNQNN